MTLDILVFAAHPDDAELSMGGSIAKLTKQNYKVGIVDLTKGELGTRGDVKTREKEAVAADKILNVSVRVNLGIPDGNIQRTKENLMMLIREIRKYKPKIIFAPYFRDRHPDHQDASALVKEAMFSTGLLKVKTFDKQVEQKAYRPKKLFYYMQTYTFEPSFIVDVSDSFEQKMKAVKAFKTQFFDSNSKEPETFISRPEFFSYLISRAQFYGFQIGKHYGEPFYCEEKIEYNMSWLL
ncbi:MAG: bacillithiol biosynthesis deacetylase BshB1 [Ignavibacteria bacterium RIFOXYB2_FULL_35_12]|nr:MAG: bacillithiol biosynthesis deacetylase BshB1 [Ignavibacteria bacterium GWA2_36_19]OGU59768.1 MAG: bacillithiol biosynthesis deacetylase BshB1 [Ignavibacteria bacterium GWF2_35_20]OGU78761.1 MAG: bacillithiol biosynthesis deacetylase BshB1 [Ignavibacteria bacterium RIFOXYA2_FULL_35_9]OGU85236.1 MAG: bacillithiol biosynthesis deacetylase BshB1 [Ignavibacteria bacterium RIFOXYA12_FULL_35_25]OGU91754.1 MAG: bacillithiol biosynthesis deacetylase BshB1 [Ignavibacteria bacterium RIFOXYC12_FULL_